MPQRKLYTIEDIYALPDGQRAALIDGQMYMMTPPNTKHQRISYSFARKISDFIDREQGNCEVFLAVMVYDLENNLKSNQYSFDNVISA